MKEDRANSKNSKLTVEWNSKNSAKEEVKSWRSSQYRRFLESEAKTSLPVTSHDIEEVMWISLKSIGLMYASTRLCCGIFSGFIV